MESLKDQQKNLRLEIKEKTIGYIVGAFGLVAGLAWNEAIKSLIDMFFPGDESSITIKFLYAFLITVVIVIITVYLLKLVSKKNE